MLKKTQKAFSGKKAFFPLSFISEETIETSPNLSEAHSNMFS